MTCKAGLNKNFVLEADPSAAHVEAVLMQYDGREPRVVAYFSRKLRPSEMRYLTTDREGLAEIPPLFMGSTSS